jgi:hypothetical protein
LDGFSVDVVSVFVDFTEGWGARHTMAFLGFLGFVASYAMRVNLSFAIVSMVNTTSSTPGGSSAGANVCTELLPNRSALTEGQISAASGPAGEFYWSGEEQGIILGSFFWGYVLVIPFTILVYIRRDWFQLGSFSLN